MVINPSSSGAELPPSERRPRGVRRTPRWCTVGVMVIFATVAGQLHGTVTAIRVEPSPPGTTVVAIDVPANVPVRAYRLSDPPRYVLRFIGIADDVSTHRLDVRDGRVIAVRAGHHPEFDPPELHVVIDLVSQETVVFGTSRGPVTVRVTLRDPSAHSAPPVVHSPTATATVTPTPTTTETATRPLRAPATSTPSATASSTRIATPLPSLATRTPIPATPTARAATMQTPTAALMATQQHVPSNRSPTPVGPSPTRGDSRLRGTLLQVVVSCRPDGTTLLRVTADAPLDDNAMEYMQAIDDPTTHVLVLEGYADPLAPRHVAVCGDAIESVDVVPDPMYPQLSTRLAIQLRDPGYDVVRGVARGEHLVLEFAATPSTTGDDPD